MSYIYKRFRKFFIPYVGVGAVITLLTALKEGMDSISGNLINLVISPKQSEATFLWYIYLLFFLYALYPLLHWSIKKGRGYTECGLLLMGLNFYANPVNVPLLCIDYFTKYFLFYILGICLSHHYSFLQQHVLWLKRIGIISLLLFIISSIFAYDTNSPIAYAVVCFSSIPAMYGLTKLCNGIAQVKDILVNISKNCFPIYLFHMFFVQGFAMLFTMTWGKPIESVGGMITYIIVSTSLSIAGVLIMSKSYTWVKAKFA